MASRRKPGPLFRVSGADVTAQFLKEPADPRWQNDPEALAYLDFMKTAVPGLDPNDWSNIIAYYMASAIAQVLNSCGEEVTRAQMLDRVSHMNAVPVPMLLPGIALNTTPSDYNAIKEMQLARFDGTRWVPLGELIRE